ncbi:hypothetical protein [Enterovibrio norvegicus]|uniref:hypothetical protein n=1 Tax=Enterovibrio norvegicus TaxID=188144 RepID=UPI0013D6E70B|nr:hypothetical protein [Enterovibrio norvegicus]
MTDIPNDTDPQAIELQSFLEKNGVVKTLAHFSGLMKTTTRWRALSQATTSVKRIRKADEKTKKERKLPYLNMMFKDKMPAPNI